MFGYVLPRSETLERRDFAMFQAAYCGLCLSIKKKYGNLARFTTNYDTTVFELLAIEAIKPQVEFGSCRCVCDPRKKVYVKDSELSATIADVNILLCYYKLADDLEDGGGKHRFMRTVLEKPYAAAKANLPDLDKVIADGYTRLREMEKNNVASIDRTSDCFARLLENLLVGVIKDKGNVGDAYYNGDGRLDEGSDYMKNLRGMCYNIGKFVYLADALDDLEEDFRKKRYNPFLAVYPDYARNKRLEYIGKHNDELKFAFASTVNRAIECFNRLPLTHVGDLLKNIVADGLREKTNQLFSSPGKLPSPVLRAPKKKTESQEK